VTHEPIEGAPCTVLGPCGDEGICDPTGTCIPNQGYGCETDADCDDGDACNGEETCSQMLGCMSGSLMPDDDGIVCTDAKCDPEIGIWTHEPNDVLCDDGNNEGGDGCSSVCTVE
jgi:cysteine-rich repeat protein